MAQDLEQLQKTVDEKEHFCLHVCRDTSLEVCARCDNYWEWREAEGNLAAAKEKQQRKEELLEDLQNEEAVCSKCEYLHSFIQSDACEACGTNGNIKDIKTALEDLEEPEEQCKGFKAKDLLPLGEAITKGFEDGLKEGAKCTEI